MKLIENDIYLNSLVRLQQNFPYWNILKGKSFLLTGATGLIGSFFVDAIMQYNQTLPENERCSIIALGRNQAKAEERFSPWFSMPEFQFITHDVRMPLPKLKKFPDYWIHAASPTHPMAFIAEPVNTIFSNIAGIQNILEYAATQSRNRVLFLSSVEIYGQNRNDTDYFLEDYCGYLDCNTLRGGYPEAKRVSEALCQAYIAQYGVDAVILRLPRCYGPTMQMTDSKVSAQFLKRAIQRKDIVLKSDGNQLYSFSYVSDAVNGILWTLVLGKTGEAYNLADKRSDITVKELAELVAKCAETNVVYEVPTALDCQGTSTVTKALMNGEKLKTLGWKARYDIASGIYETIGIMKSIYKY